MARIEEWDGQDAYGFPATILRETYPTTGKVLFLMNDAEELLTITAWAAGGLNVPITEDNEDAVREQMLASIADPVQPTGPSTPDAGTDEVVALRAQVAALQESTDWLTDVVTSLASGGTTGEDDTA